MAVRKSSIIPSYNHLDVEVERMNTRLSTVLALVITMSLPALSIYAWQMRGASISEDEMAVDVALVFLKNGATFKFDGIPETLIIGETLILESYPVQYVVTITFDSRHGGYGDRTGQMLIQVITRHTARVTVVNGEVVSATLDDVWDELNQEELDQTGEFVTAESALEAVIRYLSRTHDELQGVAVSSSWETTDLTPEGHMGASKLLFSGAGWMVNVSWAVVLEPIYTFEVEYTGDVSFSWSGTVDQTGAVEETDFEIK
jgi:hypothetical protein